LEQEREEIVKTARENNIPLEEIGLGADDLDLNFADDEEDEEEEELEEEE
jgi:hypothetical protein